MLWIVAMLADVAIAQKSVAPPRPPLELVRQIEARIMMPIDAGPLTSYSRGYRYKLQDGHWIVRGNFVRTSRPSGEIRIYDPETPDELVVTSGRPWGCDEIRLEYDPQVPRLLPYLECVGR